MEILQEEDLQLYFNRTQMEEEIQKNGYRVWNSRKEIEEYLTIYTPEGNHVIGYLNPEEAKESVGWETRKCGPLYIVSIKGTIDYFLCNLFGGVVVE